MEATEHRSVGATKSTEISAIPPGNVSAIGPEFVKDVR